ncbi:MAG: hypoxanthine phosphoribosyltransferase [Nanoarchaeota archaeon]
MNNPIDMRNLKPFDVDQLVTIPSNYKDDLKEILIPHGLIEDRISKLSEEIGNKNLVTSKNLNEMYFAICILRGASRFFHDLIKWPLEAEVDYWPAGSYSGTTSTGTVKLGNFDLTKISGRKVLLVEDIIDTGRTLNKIRNEILSQNPRSLDIVCLLDKPSCRKVDVPVNYVGFIIPDEFVVGYGLDFNERYRDLNHIGVLKEEVYRK